MIFRRRWPKTAPTDQNLPEHFVEPLSESVDHLMIVGQILEPVAVSLDA